MKLLTTCLECEEEARRQARSDGATRVADVSVLQDIRNESLYDVVCPKGHRFTVYLDHPKFELLFDMGAMAFLDGYYREAVATWAASLERFYEFFVRVICRKHGLGIPETDLAWMSTASRSRSRNSRPS